METHPNELQPLRSIDFKTTPLTAMITSIEVMHDIAEKVDTATVRVSEAVPKLAKLSESIVTESEHAARHVAETTKTAIRDAFVAGRISIEEATLRIAGENADAVLERLQVGLPAAVGVAVTAAVAETKNDMAAIKAGFEAVKKTQSMLMTLVGVTACLVAINIAITLLKR